jgi:hypothetical protein
MYGTLSRFALEIKKFSNNVLLTVVFHMVHGAMQRTEHKKVFFGRVDWTVPNASSVRFLNRGVQTCTDLYRRSLLFLYAVNNTVLTNRSANFVDLNISFALHWQDQTLHTQHLKQMSDINKETASSCASFLSKLKWQQSNGVDTHWHVHSNTGLCRVFSLCSSHDSCVKSFQRSDSCLCFCRVHICVLSSNKL